MGKIRIAEEAKDYKDCVFWNVREEYKDRHAEPDVKCENCGSYISAGLIRKLKLG